MVVRTVRALGAVRPVEGRLARPHGSLRRVLQKASKVWALALCVLVLGGGPCDAGEDVSPRDDVIVLAASHLGACRGQILVGPAGQASAPMRSFWYMGLYQLLEENGRKTDGASSAVVPMLSAHDLKQAGPDACVFLPDLRHPHGCAEWVDALEQSQVAGAVVADFLDSRGGEDAHACLRAWSARSSTAVESRLAVSMNVTLTPLDVATADPATRLPRSMLVAHVVPRRLLSASGSRSAVSGTAPHASRIDACRRACTAMGWAANSAQDCEEACLLHSHPDPHLSQTASSTLPSSADSASASATGASPRAMVPLGWYPRREAAMHEGRQQKLLSWVEVETGSLVSNAHTLRRLLGKGVKLCGVIKGNAFGHGLVPAARALEQGGADWLAVDSLEEALALRDAGIVLPVLVLYWSNPWQAPLMARLGIHASVWDQAWLVAAAAALQHEALAPGVVQEVLQVHLVLDTGLGREGCLRDDLLPLAQAILAASQAGVAISMAGVATHFCCPSDAQATQQDWAEVSAAHRDVSGLLARSQPLEHPPLAHEEEANRDGRQPALLLHAASGAPAALFPHTQGDMVRIGGLLFGILPAAGGVKQALAAAGAVPRRAFRWLTTVVSIKTLPAGSCVGYECAARSGDWPVGLLPLGSHDGFLEPSAGFRQVAIRGGLHRVLAVDANVVMVQVSPDVRVGDEVVIVGCDASAADVCSMPTLSTRVPTHLPRFYL